MQKKLSLSERRFELEQKRLILELGLAGVTQRRIREIVGCDLNIVTMVLRHVPKKRQPQEE